MERFEVTLDELYNYIAIIKKVEMTKYRLKWAFDHEDLISAKEYRFLYYSILEVDLMRVPKLDPAIEKMRIEQKYYRAIQAHVVDAGGEASRKHRNSEFF